MATWPADVAPRYQCEIRWSGDVRHYGDDVSAVAPSWIAVLGVLVFIGIFTYAVYKAIRE